MNLSVRVNDELLMDAGATEASDGELVIHQPTVTLFHQILGYLKEKPDPPVVAKALGEDQESMAALAVALRWGSYLAVLADSDKPVWPHARSPGTSRISDSEMARINIEASAALAEWIDIAREDRATHKRLVSRALAYLPLPRMRSKPIGTNFAVLAMPEVASKIIEASPPVVLAKARADAEQHPSRLFANALVNFAWRNGPVEDLHAGKVLGHPLDCRRLTAAEEGTLLGFAGDRLATGMDVCHQLTQERLQRPWSEQVLPYGLAAAMLITPTGWTLTEATREVRLPSS